MSTGAPVIPVTIASPASSVGRVDARPVQGESRAQSQRVEAPVLDMTTAEAPVEEQSQARAESSNSSRMQEAIARYLKTSQNILKFERDEGTQRVIVKVVDPETKETLRQYPPEEIMRMAESLEEVRGALVDKVI